MLSLRKSFFRTVLLMAVASAAGIAGSAADVHDGVRKYEAGDYEGAIREWLPEAAADNPYALFFLGQVYRLGRGVKADLGQAEHYYGRAARLGHVAAQGNLGTLYYFAEPPLQDIPQALHWWQEAAANGDARSQYMLGVLYFNGDHVTRDWATAYAWMSLAVAGGIAEAATAEQEMLRHLSSAEVEAGKLMAGDLVRPQPAAISPEQGHRGPAEEKSAGTAPAVALEGADALPAPRETPTPGAAPADAAPAQAPAAAAPGVPSALAGEGQWRIQLAAFRDRSQAEAAWRALQERHGATLGGLSLIVEEADLGDKGVFYRVQAGPFADKAAASAACAALGAKKQPCFAVAP
ncbi:MAG: SPOR domain-containing protein [Pseudomonadota bacterium]